MLSRLKFEISNLVNEMLDEIPDEIWESEDKTFIDPAMGGGQFVKEIERRLREKGHSDENITNRVFGMEKNKLRVNYAINKHGLIGKYWVGNHESEIDMKFDVVVGNPPYQDDSKGEAKRWPLWMKFLNKATTLTKEGGYIGFVSPASWLAPNSAFDIISARNVKYVNLGVSKYFNVGSTFSAYVFQNRISLENNKNTIFVDKLGDSSIIDWSGTKFLPNEVNSITLNLVKKFYFGNKSHFLVKSNSENHHSKKSIFGVTGDENYPFKVFHTNSQTLWSNLKNKNYDTPKVMMTLSGYQKPIYDDCCGTSEVVMFFPVKNEIEGRRLVNVLNSNLYQFMMKICKYSGFALKKVISNLPAVDLSRLWSNEELYKYFNLTNEEIQHIEKNIT